MSQIPPTLQIKRIFPEEEKYAFSDVKGSPPFYIIAVRHLYEENSFLVRYISSSDAFPRYTKFYRNLVLSHTLFIFDTQFCKPQQIRDVLYYAALNCPERFSNRDGDPIRQANGIISVIRGVMGLATQIL